jgi:hypothetical protein|nr:MAG TPA: hypothetical protein [Caudoviricetes sp.]
MRGAASYIDYEAEKFPIRPEEIKTFKDSLRVGSMLKITKKKPIYIAGSVVSYEFRSRIYVVTAKYPNVVRLETWKHGKAKKITMDYTKLYILASLE